MRTVLLRVKCSEKFSEVILDDTEQAELVIEGVVAPALLELFATVYVEDVTVQSPAESED
jgi:hypothetical protein